MTSVQIKNLPYFYFLVFKNSKNLFCLTILRVQSANMEVRIGHVCTKLNQTKFGDFSSQIRPALRVWVKQVLRTRLAQRKRSKNKIKLFFDSNRGQNSEIADVLSVSGVCSW